MFFRRKPKPKPRSRFVPPEGQRIYAIGDVHGRKDLLDVLLAKISLDDHARRPADTMIVFLGDLIDRGPDSRDVVATVRRMCEAGAARLVKGNHEELFIAAARGDRAATRTLMGVGGEATLRSYGLDDATIHAGTFGDLAGALAERIPRDDVAFLDAAEPCIALGDYLFVHAGIEPGVPIEEQDEETMRWIRERFTGSERDHGLMVVHGHTVSERIEHRANRIGIDTGAYASGRLSAVGVEGDAVWFLQASDAQPPFE